MSNLSPDQFFHGTTHQITDGMVRPANAADKNVSEYSMGDPGDMSEGDHAFVTKDENYAWHAAGTFHKNGRRPRVYETGPAADMKPGPWNKEHPDFLHHVEYGDPKEYPPHEHPQAYAEAIADSQPEYASKTGFPIKRRIDIMPGHQGTFPSINWNKYKDGSPAWGPDANHPSDAHIEHGMYPKEEPKPAPAAPRARQKGESLRDFMAGKPPPDPQGTLF